MSDRRTFLRGLASLPLIGGSISLVGQPTAAAVPVTTDLLERYKNWLSIELGETIIELAAYRRPEHALTASAWRREWCLSNKTLNPGGDRFLRPPITLPSTRAAVILSAAGVRVT